MIDLLFAYGAGLLTLINPCVLPVLPIVLASSLQEDRRGPLALSAGMGLSFVTLGVGVTAFGSAVGLDQTLVSQIAAIVMIGFGLVLLTPRLGEAFAGATAGFASQADVALSGADGGGLRKQFLTGALLGAVWSPCIGPTLGGAIALASQRADLGWAALIMTFFALGVATLILVLGYGAREALRARTNSLRGLAERSKPILGGALVAVGAAILLGLHHVVEAWLIQVLPIWLQDLSVSL